MLFSRNLPWTLSWAFTRWGLRLTPLEYPPVYQMICHGCGPLSRTFCRILSSACHGTRLQFGIVGSGRPPLQSTRTERWQESSHRRGTEATRVSCAFLLIVALLPLRVVGCSRSPGPAHCIPPWQTWVHSLPVRPGGVTPLFEGFASLNPFVAKPTKKINKVENQQFRQAGVQTGGACDCKGTRNSDSDFQCNNTTK